MLSVCPRVQFRWLMFLAFSLQVWGKGLIHRLSFFCFVFSDSVVVFPLSSPQWRRAESPSTIWNSDTKLKEYILNILPQIAQQNLMTFNKAAFFYQGTWTERAFSVTGLVKRTPNPNIKWLTSQLVFLKVKVPVSRASLLYLDVRSWIGNWIWGSQWEQRNAFDLFGQFISTKA